DRVVAPIRRATSLGLSSSGMSGAIVASGPADRNRRGCRASLSAADSPGLSTPRLGLVGMPGRPALLVEGGKALLRLRARPLTGDDAGGVPFRRAVAQPPDLADNRLRRADGGRTRSQDVRDDGVDREIEGGVALDHLVDEPDPLRPQRVEPAAAG